MSPPFGAVWIISIHALLAESDILAVRLGCRSSLFLSTLSLRRATSSVNTADQEARFLSTLSLRRATDAEMLEGRVADISIHALLAESDVNKVQLDVADPEFLSTLSLRRATRKRQSISVLYHHFYPRSPCGERLNCSRNGFAIRYFYPRSPCGERRAYPAACRAAGTISIHALLAESDLRS